MPKFAQGKPPEEVFQLHHLAPSSQRLSSIFLSNPPFLLTINQRETRNRRRFATVMPSLYPSSSPWAQRKEGPLSPSPLRLLTLLEGAPPVVRSNAKVKLFQGAESAEGIVSPCKTWPKAAAQGDLNLLVLAPRTF